MSQHIQCTLRHSPEALERVLQIIRIRGFRLLSLRMEQHDDELHLDFQVDGERAVANLLRQLHKVVGMQQLCIPV